MKFKDVLTSKNYGYELPPVDGTLVGISALADQLSGSNAGYFAHPLLRTIQSIATDALWTIDFLRTSAIDPLPVIAALESIPLDDNSCLHRLKNSSDTGTELNTICDWYDRTHLATSKALEEHLLTTLSTSLNQGKCDADIMTEIEHAMPTISRDPIQWNLESLKEIAQWVDFIANPKYWHGDPPFYIFDPARKPFTSVPRMYSDQHAMALFRFRYFTPRADMLTDTQLDTMWSQILVEEQLYESVDTQPERRQSVLRTVVEQVPHANATVLDVCGGTGAVIDALRQLNPDNTYYMTDISSQGVRHAQEVGINAIRANIAREIPKGIPPVDLTILFFSIHVLPQAAINNVYQCLKPGGSLVLNVFPPGEKTEAETIEKLRMAGFSLSNIVSIPADNGIDIILKAARER